MFFTDSPIRKRVAWVTTLAVAWLTLGPSAGAWAQSQRLKRANVGHTRTLTPFELKHFKGQRQQGGGGLEEDHDLSVDPASGTTYPWEGNVGNTNTGNGNKLTEIPIVGWTARGGLPVSFSIAHNSQSTHNSELGYHWTHSFDIYLAVDSETGDAAVHWGNDLSYVFTQNIDGSFSAPTGIHDSLSYNSGTSTYTLTTKGQVKYAFTQIASQWVCGTITDRSNNTLTINHNSNAYVTSVVDPSSRTLSFSYNGSNQITSVTDPASRTFSFSYSSGNLSSVTYPTAGSQTPVVSFGYDASHRITSKTDPRGKVWSLTYNSDGSLASVTDPLSHTTTYTYLAGSTTVTDALGRSVVHNYSGGLLASVVAPGSSTTSFGYDSAFNKTSVTDPLSNVTSFTYDSKGNVLTVTDALSNVTTYTYNSNNDVLTVTSPSGKVVTYSYNSAGNRTSVSSPGSYTTSLTVNSNGLVTAKTDSNSKTTSYSYNSNGDLSSMTTPGGKVTSWSYNALGLRTGQTDNLSRTITVSYDNLARVTSKSGSGFSNSYSYDIAGNLTSFTDATGTTTRSYNDAEQLTSETKSGNTVSYAYDAVGNVTSVTDPTSRVQSYTYTNRNQLASVTVGSAVTSYSYDGKGQETAVSHANGVEVSKGYDAAGKLTSITNVDSSSTTLSSFSYTYTSDGKRSSVTEADGSVVSYTYNTDGRLTGESRTGSNSYSLTYTLDGEGRRTSMVKNGTTTTFSYDSDDAVTGLSGGVSASFSYNGVGEQTSRTVNGSTWSLSWSTDGQLTGMSGPSGATRSFGYDGLDRRVSRTANGTTTLFTRTAGENGGQVLVESVGSSATALYVYGNGLVGKSGEANLYDGLGSTRQVTNSSGSISSSNLSDAFGNVVSSSGSVGAYKFAATSGYRDDGDGGLVHIAARYYDSLTGQFVSRDSYLDQKPYSYCEGDPVNTLDPSGHDRRGLWNVFWIGLGGAIGATIPGGPIVIAIGRIGGSMLGYLTGDFIWGLHGPPPPYLPLPQYQTPEKDYMEAYSKYG